MKLRSLLFIFFLLPFAGKAQTFELSFPPSRVPDRIILTLTDDPSHSMAVNWRTSVEVKGAIAQLNLATGSPQLFYEAQAFKAETQLLVTDENAAHYHSVVFSDLQPNTLYAYRVGDGDVWSEWFHFRTAPKRGEPFSFIYFGDAQNNLKSLWSRAIRSAFTSMPDANFMLHAGDLINVPNKDSEWGEWFYAGGWIYGQMPSMLTPGNHEYQRLPDGTKKLTDHWKPTFTLPTNGPDSLKETVYYIDYQNTRIVSLNSQAFFETAQDSMAQVQWLEKVLSDHKKEWLIVTMHHPVWSTKMGRDNPSLRQAFQPIFEKYKVDLVLQGHDHAYGRGASNIPSGMNRLKIDEPMYVVSVSGPKMYDLGLEKWLHRAATNTQLYQLITIDKNELIFKAYTVDGILYDAFTLKKKGSKKMFYEQEPLDVPERLTPPPAFQNRYKEVQWDIFHQRFEAYKARKNRYRKSRE